MVNKNRTLPDYETPPVTEVVVGVQFDPLPNYNALHPGVYRQRIKDRYPKYEARPPLQKNVEFFEGMQPPLIGCKLTGVPPVPRSWFIEEKENPE